MSEYKIQPVPDTNEDGLPNMCFLSATKTAISTATFVTALLAMSIY